MDSTTIIYIIDDDLDDQEFLIEAIKEIDLSIECYTAINGQEGLTRLETGAVPFPSLVFLDLNMPRTDGRKFLTAIKKHTRFCSIPVVVYSTSDNDRDRYEVMKMGATDYLVKQSDFALLKNNLATIILHAE
jgi:CheY-like chemotaxis protein